MGQTLQTFPLTENIIRGLPPFLFRQFIRIQHICIADDGGQRCLQFMGKCRCKVLLLFRFQLFFFHLVHQAVRHPVKAAG